MGVYITNNGSQYICSSSAELKPYLPDILDMKLILLPQGHPDVSTRYEEYLISSHHPASEWTLSRYETSSDISIDTIL